MVQKRNTLLIDGQHMLFHRTNEVRTSQDHLFSWLIRITTPSDEAGLTPEDIRRYYYVFKLLDFVWFESIPENMDAGFNIYTNPMRLKDLPPDGTGEIVHLSSSCLQYLCKRLERPKWAENDGLGFVASLNKLINIDSLIK